MDLFEHWGVIYTCAAIHAITLDYSSRSFIKNISETYIRKCSMDHGMHFNLPLAPLHGVEVVQRA